MFHVEVRSHRRRDEKLASVCVRASVSHRKKSWLVEFYTRYALISKSLTPDGLSPSACASRISALDHKIFDDSMENNSIVVPFRYKTEKVLACFRSDIGFQCDFKISKVRFKNDDWVFHEASLLCCDHKYGE